MLLRRLLTLVVLACILLASRVTLAEDPPVKDNDFVAICGDSITEQKLYSIFIEDYLLMCKPVASVQSVQFGWGGEAAPGFNGRMENDVLVFKPTIATTYYGMNDGGYTPYKDEIGDK